MEKRRGCGNKRVYKSTITPSSQTCVEDPRAEEQIQRGVRDEVFTGGFSR
jgi:hypothetical protein